MISLSMPPAYEEQLEQTGGARYHAVHASSAGLGRAQAAAKAAAEVEAAMSAARASVTETNSEHTGSPCSHHFSPLEPLTEPPLTRNMLRSGNGPGAFQHPSLVQAQQEGARLHGKPFIALKGWICGSALLVTLCVHC